MAGEGSGSGPLVAAARRIARTLGVSTQAVVVTLAVGGILAAGVLALPSEPEWMPSHELAVTHDPCDADGITLDWTGIDFSSGIGSYVVDEVEVGGVDEGCITGVPVILTLYDASTRSLGSVTLRNSTSPMPVLDATLTFDLSPHPVPAEAIYAVSVEIPDPFGTTLEVTTGTDVTVAFKTDTTPPAVIDLTFPEVTSGGTVLAQLATPGAGGYPPLPADSTGGTAGLFFDLTASTGFVPPVTICVTFDPTRFDEPSTIGLFHYVAGAWVRLDAAQSPAPGFICAEVESFSPFALLDRPVTVTLTGPTEPTAGTEVDFRVSFSEPVTDVTAADFSSGQCTVDDPITTIDSTTYSVHLSGCAPGAITLTLRARGAVDAALNEVPETDASGTGAGFDDEPATIAVVERDPTSGILFYTGSGTQTVSVRFRASDLTTGGSRITSIEYRIYDVTSGAWIAAPSPTDGTYDEVTEDLLVTHIPSRPGTVTICARATDAVGLRGPATCTSFTITSITTYTGVTFRDMSGATTATISMSVLVQAESAACFTGGSVTFRVVSFTDGSTVDTKPGVFGSGTDARTATATSKPLPGGLYQVDASYGTSAAGCYGSSDSAIVALVSPTDKSNGGGWYRVRQIQGIATNPNFPGGGTPRVSFGYSIQQISVKVGKAVETRYIGQIVWLNKNQFRIRARVDGSATDGSYGQYTCPASFFSTVPTGSIGVACGAFRAIGTLEEWNPVTSRWQVSTQWPTVTVVGNAFDGGRLKVCKTQGKKQTCTESDNADWFGLQVDPVPSTAIRESVPLLLGGGSVNVR